MAVKRRAKPVREREVFIDETPKFEAPDTVTDTSGQKKKLLWLAAIAGLIGIFWYKTNTWPIVAMVGSRPITRFEVNQTLFKTQGAQAVDNIVTTELVKKALKKEGVEVPESEVEAKISEIESSLGEGGNLEELLAERGLDMREFREQLRLRIGIEKVAQNRVSVSEEQVDTYLKDNAAFLTGTTDDEKKLEAREALEQQGLQNAIVDWIEKVRSEGRVWRFGVAEVPSL